MIYQEGGLLDFKVSIYRPSDLLCFSNLHNIKNLCRNINFRLLGLSYVVT